MKSNEIGVSYKIRCFRLCLDFIKKNIILSTLRTTWFTFTITIWRKHKFTRTFRCLHFFVFFFLFTFSLPFVRGWASLLFFLLIFFSGQRVLEKSFTRCVCCGCRFDSARFRNCVYKAVNSVFITELCFWSDVQGTKHTLTLFFTLVFFNL